MNGMNCVLFEYELVVFICSRIEKTSISLMWIAHRVVHVGSLLDSRQTTLSCQRPSEASLV